MSWFKRDGGEYGPGLRSAAEAAESRVRTEGLWIKCVGCRAVIWKADLLANLNVCPKCQHHFKIGARQRIDLLLEPGYELVDGGLRSTDPLNFTDIKPYKQRLKQGSGANRPRRRHPQRHRPPRPP
jgi:acetyl-CoA carboxylase carboxyl transferase subunit beta